MVTFVLRSSCPPSEFERTCNPLFTKPSLITYICVCIPYIIKGQGGGEYRSGDLANHLCSSFIYLSPFFFHKPLDSLFYSPRTFVHTLQMYRQIDMKRRKSKALNLILWRFYSLPIQLVYVCKQKKKKKSGPVFRYLFFLGWDTDMGLPSIRWQTGERLR